MPSNQAAHSQINSWEKVVLRGVPTASTPSAIISAISATTSAIGLQGGKLAYNKPSDQAAHSQDNSWEKGVIRSEGDSSDGQDQTLIRT
jgi:hypothetical protein